MTCYFPYCGFMCVVVNNYTTDFANSLNIYFFEVITTHNYLSGHDWLIQRLILQTFLRVIWCCHLLAKICGVRCINYEPEEDGHTSRKRINLLIQKPQNLAQVSLSFLPPSTSQSTDQCVVYKNKIHLLIEILSPRSVRHVHSQSLQVCVKNWWMFWFSSSRLCALQIYH